MSRNNGRSRGNYSFQTHRRPSAHLLRGRLTAPLVFPLLRSIRLLLLLTVITVLFAGYSLAGKQQDVKRFETCVQDFLSKGNENSLSAIKSP